MHQLTNCYFAKLVLALKYNFHFLYLIQFAKNFFQTNLCPIIYIFQFGFNLLLKQAGPAQVGAISKAQK